MKKLFVVFISIFFAISIAGCSDNPKSDEIISESIGLNDVQNHLLQQALKDNGENRKIRKIEMLTEASYEITCGKKIYTLILTEDKMVNKIITQDDELLFLNIESLPIPAENTLEALDYIFSKAKEDVKTLSKSDAKRFYEYIVDTGSANVADLFADNKTMEKCIYYAALLELNYLDKDENISAFGNAIVDLLEGVYIGTEKVTDSTIQEKINHVGNVWVEVSESKF